MDRIESEEQHPTASRFPPQKSRCAAALTDCGMRAAGTLGAVLNAAIGTRAGTRFGILMYHRVARRLPNAPPPTFNVSPQRLRYQLAGLLDRGFHFEPLRAVLAAGSRRDPVPPRTIVLTFDDGFQTTYDEAWPVLRQLGVPATLFLNTAYLDTETPFPFDVWGKAWGGKVPPDTYRPLTTAQCREMVEDGLLELGAHTHTHEDFRGRPEAFRSDLRCNLDILRERFGLREAPFAFPVGSVHARFASPDLVAVAKQAGVVCGLTTDADLVDPRADPFTWGRFNVFPWDTPRTLAAKLDGWYGWAPKFRRRVLPPFGSSGPMARGAASAVALAAADSESKRPPECAPGTQRQGTPPSDPPGQSQAKWPGHVVFMTNRAFPPMVSVCSALARRVARLTVLASTPEGLHGSRDADWDSLDVRVQRTWSLHRRVTHPMRFREDTTVHIPWDTITVLRELRPDVIVSSEMGCRSFLSALYARRKPGTPLVIAAALSEHTERGRGWLRRRFRSWLVGQADCLTYNGKSAARYLRSLGSDEQRMFHVPYVARAEASAGVQATREGSLAHRLLYVGQLIERKGLLPFAQSLARWGALNPSRSAEWELVGDGPLESALKSVRLPNNITLRLVGRCDYTELPAYYSRAGIFVFPTFCDEWGVVVHEAMAAGLPILGSVYSQAVLDLCAEGETGWLYHTEMPNELDRALAAAMDASVEQLDRMRSACRRRVEPITVDYAVENLLTAVTTAAALRRKCKQGHGGLA